jgi:hypothetical protein
MIKDAAKREYRVSAFVQAIANSPQFTMGRAAAPATTTTPVP